MVISMETIQKFILNSSKLGNQPLNYIECDLPPIKSVQ